MMNNLKPINLLPARERVASSLRKAILARELAAGEDITLEGIATQLGVSSTPVREAFQILAQDGLIKLRPNKGAVVIGVTEKMIKDYYELRAILERNAAAILCRNKADLTAVVKAYQREAEAIEKEGTDEFASLDLDFHMEIWSACGNEKMQVILSGIWNSLPVRYSATDGDFEKNCVKEHADILEALEACNEILAKERMDIHIYHDMDNTLGYFEK